MAATSGTDQGDVGQEMCGVRQEMGAGGGHFAPWGAFIDHLAVCSNKRDKPIKNVKMLHIFLFLGLFNIFFLSTGGSLKRPMVHLVCTKKNYIEFIKLLMEFSFTKKRYYFHIFDISGLYEIFWRFLVSNSNRGNI